MSEMVLNDVMQAVFKTKFKSIQRLYSPEIPLAQKKGSNEVFTKNYISYFELNCKTLGAFYKKGARSLPEKISEELEISIHIEEKGNGFLRGKTISIRTCGDEKKLNIFKQLMQTHLVIKNNTNIYSDNLA